VVVSQTQAGWNQGTRRRVEFTVCCILALALLHLVDYERIGSALFCKGFDEMRYPVDSNECHVLILQCSSSRLHVCDGQVYGDEIC